MLVTLVSIAAAAVVGVLLQRRYAGAGQLRDRMWTFNYVVLIPLAAVYALLAIELDTNLLALVATWIVAWWITVFVAGGWAALSCADRPRRGAVWLAGAFPNTGFLGFPLSFLAFGTDGLQYAILYDQISLVVPAVVVSTMIARRFGSSGDDPGESLLRIALLSPPLWTVLAVFALRATIVPEPIELELLGSAIGHLIGPYGFLLLGLSLPLGGFSHDRADIVATTGAVAIRTTAAPLLVLAVAALAGVDVPAAVLLIAAMPTAFHALILGRVNGLDGEILRLAIVVSSALVTGAALAIAVLR